MRQNLLILLIILFAGLVGLLLIISNSVSVEPTRKNQSQSQTKESFSEEQEDPYGKKPILGTILTNDFLMRTLSIDIELGKSQENAVKDIMWDEEEQLRLLKQANLPPEPHTKRFYQILGSTDKKIKQVLNPLQYARFRDWVIEQWELELHLSAPQYNLTPKKLEPSTAHFVRFLATEVKLAENEMKVIRQRLWRNKQEILLMRRTLLNIIRNPYNTREIKKTRGHPIIVEIQKRFERLEMDVLNLLPSDKRTFYLSLKSTSPNRSEIE